MGVAKLLRLVGHHRLCLSGAELMQIAPQLPPTALGGGVGVAARNVADRDRSHRVGQQADRSPR